MNNDCRCRTLVSMSGVYTLLKQGANINMNILNKSLDFYAFPNLRI